MSKSIEFDLLTHVRLLAGIAICLVFIGTSLKAVAETESTPVKIHSDIFATMVKEKDNVWALHLNNFSESPIEVKCNIPSLLENQFAGFPVSASIQFKDSNGDVFLNKFTDKKGWWKPSSLSSKIHPDWAFIREMRLGVSAKNITYLDPTEALKFAKTLKVFELDDIAAARISVDVIVENEGRRVVQRVYSEWFNL